MNKKVRNGLIGVVVVAATLLCIVLWPDGKGYLSAIPKGVTALVSVDGVKLPLMNRSGIDISKKTYMFETIDGTLGMVAKVSDADDLEKWLAHQSGQKPAKHRDQCFGVLKDQWVVGFNDESVIILGPCLPGQQQEMMRQEMRCLRQDGEVENSEMFHRLEKIDSRVAMVAQAQALPQQVIAPFTLGAPENARPSDVYIAAEMNVTNGCLLIDGQTFSFDENINKQLQAAQRKYRPLKGKYLNSIPQHALVSFVMNIQGNDFLLMMKHNKQLQALLMGINTAIDMDAILKSVDGDMAIILPDFTDKDVQLMWGADLKDRTFVRQVEYWKKSCKPGTSLVDTGKDSWHYSGDADFYFGATANDVFYLASKPEYIPIMTTGRQPESLRSHVIRMLQGQRMAAVISFGAMGKENQPIVNTFASLLKPLFGDVSTIVYRLKDNG